MFSNAEQNLSPCKLMLIVNPFSGGGLSKSALGDIVSQFCNNGFVVTVYFAGESDPEALAFEYAKHHDLAVCAGGDGTLSAVVSGILRSGVSIPVGYIPNGTANDVATTLALPKKPSAAAQRIIDGTDRPHDIGLFSGRYFTYVAAFGAFTGVAYNTKQSAKRALGKFAYILGGLSNVFSVKARRTVVEHDGGVIKGDFIFGCVINSTSVAGLIKIDHKQVDLADGMFEVILVKRPISLADFFKTVTNTLSKRYNGDNVQLIHSSNVVFSFDEDVAWTVDGENGGMHKEARITNCHKAIRIIV